MGPPRRKRLLNDMTLRGLFISFEGGEGCGKTTQIQKLAVHIEKIALAPFVVTREPGGVPAAELIREILVKGDAETWRTTTEGLLMSAARHEHVEQIIRPALAQNKLVISDRFVDSTVVYQGIVGGVSASDIAAMNKIACGDIYPDVTIILDIDSQIGLARAKSRGARRIVLKPKVTPTMKRCGLDFLKSRPVPRRVAW